MSLQEETAAARVLAERARYVARGVSTPRLVVARAFGARIEDVDGRSYIDFAGGIGCHNLGHNNPAAVAAIHEQVDLYLHQCFMVGTYEPYVEVCRLLAELSPCGKGEQRSLLLNSGAEAIENAVKIARTATGRPAVVAFDNGFHGRTLLTMTMTSKVVPYKKGFGPFAPEVYRAPAPYPYRGVSSDEAIHGLERLFKSGRRPGVGRLRRARAGAGGGRLHPDAAGLSGPPPGALPRARDPLRRRRGAGGAVARTGPVWAIEHYDGVEPDLLVSGKSLGGGMPLTAVTGRAEVMDAVDPGGLGGTFGGNPVACAAAVAVLEEVSAPEFRDRAIELGERMRGRLEALAERTPQIGEVRGLGPMLGVELVADRDSRTPAPALAKAVVDAAFERGLLLLSCGTYGNVLRTLVPLVVTDEELEQGLGILEESLADAGAGAA